MNYPVLLDADDLSPELPLLRLFIYSDNCGAEAAALGVVPIRLEDVGLSMGELEVTLDVEACPGCEAAQGEVKFLLVWNRVDEQEANAELLRKAAKKKRHVEKKNKADEKKKEKVGNACVRCIHYFAAICNMWCGSGLKAAGENHARRGGATGGAGRSGRKRAVGKGRLVGQGTGGSKRGAKSAATGREKG